ncbi:MAG: radical SAM protein [Planctomycetes bacterium]|nr:radical SAM protein [Planctomycetota bacterium]
MIGISRLLCSESEPFDKLRYRHRQSGKPRRPIVVWNITQQCNLRCLHCYSHSSENIRASWDDLEKGYAFIDSLADYGVPVLLFSGGEPLFHPHLFEWVAHARAKKLHVVISTNGTLISEEKAARLKELNVDYVGVSLDGLEKVNDRFRGKAGAFREALTGIRNCRAAGLKVGLRFTITAHNKDDLGGVFDLLVEEDIPRACFYHLAYAGRGGAMQDADLTPQETRAAIDLLVARTRELYRRGIDKEILTVDNHADGVYLLQILKEENHPRAAEVEELLKSNGGNASGVAIASVGWDGSVYPDQFWRNQCVGNVHEKSFGEIWSDPSQPLLGALRDRQGLLKERCGACRHLPICNGNLRVRAEAATGDMWASDPACYLSDEEIGIT